MVDVTDYAAPGIMRRARAPQGGARWPARFWLPDTPHNQRPFRNAIRESGAR